jgi:Ni2+-binding GTPase involved in maturation of urease and hydrogenase
MTFVYRFLSFCPYFAFTKQVFIGISGLIGAGKTTLATALGKVMNLPAYYEPVISNEYLAGMSAHGCLIF